MDTRSEKEFPGLKKELSFSSLPLRSELLNNLLSLNYQQMTPIQAQSLPFMLNQMDVIAQAQTGSGKTVAFGLNILQHLKIERTSPQALYAGIKTVKPGVTLGDIGHAIQSVAERQGYSVVREYCGHGIGQKMHEDPQVLHYGRPGQGAVIEEGMTFTIEPMINQGKADVKHLQKGGWMIAVTKDRKLSAQWEHTILVTPTGYDILTWREEEEELIAKVSG
jgi:hypothetical protein